MQDLPDDIAGIIPIGHVTAARLRATCTRVRRQFPAKPATPTADDWITYGAVEVGCGRATITLIDKTPVMTLQYYTTTIVRQVAISRRVRYCGVHALNLGRSDPRIRHILLEIFGRSLEDAPIFFTEVPRWWDDLCSRGSLSSLCGIWGGIKSSRQLFYDVHWPAPQCCSHVAGELLWGPYNEFVDRARICVYIHVCAHNCDEYHRTCTHYQDKFAPLPAEIIGQIMDRLSDAREFARTCRRIYGVFQRTPEYETIQLLSARKYVAAASISPPKMYNRFKATTLYLSGNVRALMCWAPSSTLLTQLAATPAAGSVNDPDGQLADYVVAHYTGLTLRCHLPTFVRHRHTALVRRILLRPPSDAKINECIPFAMDNDDMNMVQMLCDKLHPAEFRRGIILFRVCASSCPTATKFITYFVLRGALESLPATWAESICRYAADDLQVLRALGVWFAREYTNGILRYAAPRGEIHEYLRHIAE